MARDWKQVRQEAGDAGLIDEARIARLREVMGAEVRVYRLSEIRKGMNLSQRALADEMDVSQARISKIERGELGRTELGTLESYVEALGGRIKVVVEFGNELLVVHG